ncbi:MAG: PAC2 family protein [Candidatus Bathyarchaeia archaeon]
MIKDIGEKVELRKPILIEGFPGLGMVGEIAVQYMIEELKASPMAELYSPFFPFHVLVNDEGELRLLRAEFYYWKNPEENLPDLVLLKGDAQPQTLEGQYEVSSVILSYAKSKGVRRLIALGGYEAYPEGEPKVIAASTDQDFLKEALLKGCILGQVGNPILGLAGVILGIAPFYGIQGLALLAETPGYAPDPKGSKGLLKILEGLLRIRFNYERMDKEIAKAGIAINRAEEVYERTKAIEKSLSLKREERITYIS